jgi:hypothetical protein
VKEDLEEGHLSRPLAVAARHELPLHLLEVDPLKNARPKIRSALGLFKRNIKIWLDDTKSLGQQKIVTLQFLSSDKIRVIRPNFVFPHYRKPVARPNLGC